MKSFLDGYLTEGCAKCNCWSNEHGCESPLPISDCEHFTKMMMEEEKAKLKDKKSKYYVHICSCGAIHFIPIETLNNVWNKNTEMLHVCGYCGKLTVFGADEHIGDEYDDFEDGHDCYQYDINLNPDNALQFSSELIGNRSVIKATEIENDLAINKLYCFKNVYYDKGYKPILKAFNQTNIATSFYNGYFSSDILVLSQYRSIKNVDMRTLVEDLGEEKCFALSRYLIPGLDWKGTKYEL